MCTSGRSNPAGRNTSRYKRWNSAARGKAVPTAITAQTNATNQGWSRTNPAANSTMIDAWLTLSAVRSSGAPVALPAPAEIASLVIISPHLM
jgi:hypothetical protein